MERKKLGARARARARAQLQMDGNARTGFAIHDAHGAGSRLETLQPRRAVAFSRLDHCFFPACLLQPCRPRSANSMLAERVLHEDPGPSTVLNYSSSRTDPVEKAQWTSGTGSRLDWTFDGW